jgi:hypothetical protein
MTRINSATTGSGNPTSKTAVTGPVGQDRGRGSKLLQPANATAFVSAAPVATAATNTSPYGYATQAQADAIRACVNEMRAALISVGIMK